MKIERNVNYVVFWSIVRHLDNLNSRGKQLGTIYSAIKEVEKQKMPKIQNHCLTKRLLQIVGSPFEHKKNEIVGHKNFPLGNTSEIYQYATTNRMSLLYLEALKRLNKLTSLKEEYDKLLEKYAKTNEVINRASNVLNTTGVEYALFKSIRPYQEVTVDIDILVFGIFADYEQVIHLLHEEDYVFLGDGPLSTTFCDGRVKIGLDIYYEIGASHVIYINKNHLKGFVCDRKLPKYNSVLSLCPEADLLAVIAHSVIKEHMYVLSEYYTTIYYLAEMNESKLKSFLSLVDRCKLRLAAQTHLGITALLHYKAHGFIPSILSRLLEELEVNQLELSRIEKKEFVVPYKFHLLTIFRALIEKFKERKARRSFALQFFRMMNLKFSLSLITDVIQHIIRESY